MKAMLFVLMALGAFPINQEIARFDATYALA